MNPSVTLRLELEHYAYNDIKDFRDIPFNDRMRLCGLYFQTLSTAHQWDVLSNLEDNGYFVKSIGSAMAGDKVINNEIVGNTLVTLIYSYLEDHLRDLYNDVYYEHCISYLERSDDAYRNFVSRTFESARIISNN